MLIGLYIIFTLDLLLYQFVNLLIKFTTIVKRYFIFLCFPVFIMLNTLLKFDILSGGGKLCSEWALQKPNVAKRARNL